MEMESQNSSPHSSDVVSAVSLSITEEADDDLDIESMTGRGIKHLCYELRELKEAANEDLQKNIFSKYSSFLRILEEVTGVENELVQLENHLLSHKRLVKDLIDRIYPKILSIDLALEDHKDVVPSDPNKLEAHINDVSEKLDILISENRIDEALNFLESTNEHYQSIKLQDSFHREIMVYNSVISEKKSMLVQQLVQIAENKRTAGTELQGALAGLCRLGDCQLAIHLLLKYYHLRIETETDNLKRAKSSSNETYIRELARFVFSMISQVARSFVMLYGETPPYTSELMQWAYKETNSFIICFDKYVKLTLTSGGNGMSSAIKAAKFAILYCSLLEDQKMMLRPYLLKHLYPCMEEVFNTHINHFKKVILIFSASDPWILDKYLVSGLFVGAGSSTIVGEQPDYCLLTASGRKFLTLMQAIVEDISPLVSLQMGSLVIKGITNLFTEYTIILERAMTYEKSSPGIKFSESLPQQISILANLSTLVHFLSTMVRSIFSSPGHMDSQVMENHSIVHQQQELDDLLLFIEEGSNKLRNVFYQKLILKILSTYHNHEIFSALYNNDQFDAKTIHNLMPSGIFQVLFLELRKIEQLDRENVFQVNWLTGLLRELMEFMFIWVSENKKILVATEENTSLQTDEAKQFILDVEFLVEIGMYGGYFSKDPLFLLTLMKSTFSSVGLDLFKDVDDDDWAIDIATKTIQKLLEIEKTILQTKELVVTTKEESSEHENQINQSTYGCNFSEEDEMNSSENNIDTLDAEKDEAAKDESEVVADARTASLDKEFIPGEGSPMKRDCIDRQLSNISLQLENTNFEMATNTESDELAPASFVGEVGHNSEEIISKLDE